MTENGIICLRNHLAECKLALWGGNLLSYRPLSEEQDIFWLGALNKFDNIQAIRGGIPVCWPRFAEEQLNNQLPRHGFARLSMWQLQKAEVTDEKIEAELTLPIDDKYNLAAELRLIVKITDKLESPINWNIHWKRLTLVVRHLILARPCTHTIISARLIMLQSRVCPVNTIKIHLMAIFILKPATLKLIASLMPFLNIAIILCK